MARNPVQFQRGYSLRCVDLPEADPDVFERMHPRGKDATIHERRVICHGGISLAPIRFQRGGDNAFVAGFPGRHSRCTLD